MIICEDEELRVRRLEPEDAPLLVEWLSDPEVLRYYEGRDRPHDLELVMAHFYAVEEPEAEMSRCIMLYHGQPIGYVQYYLLEEAERREYGYSDQEIIYGMDQFIGVPDYWGKGIGKRLIGAVTCYLFTGKGAKRIVMDPQSWNMRALTCYERSGFRRVKLLKEHEWHEGAYRDCWLMECVADGQ